MLLSMMSLWCYLHCVVKVQHTLNNLPQSGLNSRPSDYEKSIFPTKPLRFSNLVNLGKVHRQQCYLWCYIYGALYDVAMVSLLGVFSKWLFPPAFNMADNLTHSIFKIHQYVTKDWTIYTSIIIYLQVCKNLVEGLSCRWVQYAYI